MKAEPRQYSGWPASVGLGNKIRVNKIRYDKIRQDKIRFNFAFCKRSPCVPGSCLWLGLRGDNITGQNFFSCLENNIGKFVHIAYNNVLYILVILKKFLRLWLKKIRTCEWIAFDPGFCSSDYSLDFWGKIMWWTQTWFWARNFVSCQWKSWLFEQYFKIQKSKERVCQVSDLCLFH